ALVVLQRDVERARARERVEADVERRAGRGAGREDEALDGLRRVAERVDRELLVRAGARVLDREEAVAVGRRGVTVAEVHLRARDRRVRLRVRDVARDRRALALGRERRL